jgi:S1-C subfamily serine protease
MGEAMIRRLAGLGTVGAACALAGTAGAEETPARIDDAVAQVIVTTQAPDWREPWRMEPMQQGTGSGFVIKGRRLLTNAHVVSWPKEIYVKRTRDNEAYPARVAFVGHDCDLAILEVTAAPEKFFADTRPMELSEGLPALRSTVNVYGYPTSGKRMSVTEGVVSRMDVHPYAHSGTRSLVAVQMDAAINPGNSGGPVLQQGAVIGVAFQGTPSLENTGFFIPAPVARRFLKDVEDGTYDGVISPEFNWVPLRNKAERQLLGSRDEQGILVDAFLPGSRMAEHLRINDVIYKVAGMTIGTDGTTIMDGNRFHWSVSFMTAQSGDKVRFEILRDGKALNLEIPVFPYKADAAQGPQYDTPPKYFVYAGMVFTPLSQNYMRSAGRSADTELSYALAYHGFDHPDKWRPEPVVFSHVLTHSVNADFTVKGLSVVDQVNGVRVTCMEDLVKGFGTEPKRGIHMIEFTSGQMEAIDKGKADAANAAILSEYGIPTDRRM